MLTVFYTLIVTLTPRRASEALTGLAGLVLAGVVIFHFVIVMNFLVMPQIRYIGHPPVYFSLSEQIFMFLNPIMWLSLLDRSMDQMVTYPSRLFLEQFILFVLFLTWGLRKWRRA